MKISNPVPTNVFTVILQGTLGFNNYQIKVLVEDGYYTQESVLHWKFTDIKEWCQLESKKPVICCGIYVGDRKINFLQALAWWATDLIPRH